MQADDTASRTNVEPSVAEIVAALREVRFNAGVRCPRCGWTGVRRWGAFAGRFRYRCKSCLRTFSDLTATPAAYRKKLKSWPEYSRCMSDSLSLRRSAALCDIHLSTSFRWRHAIAAWLRKHDSEYVSGWIELGWLRFAHSQKGRRHLRRAPRRRGIRFLIMDPGPKVSVLVACDRGGHAVDSLCSGDRPAPSDIIELLTDRIDGCASNIVAEYAVRALDVYFSRRGVGHFHDARSHVRMRRDAYVHVRTARAFLIRLKRWLAGFRGVATKYLPNYLVWFRLVDRGWRDACPRLLLRWPADRSVPA